MQKIDGRKSQIEYFMDICKIVSERSTCPRAQVGAIITKDKTIVSTGFNGAPRGANHCTEAKCIMEGDHCVRTVHAEENCILNAARCGIDIRDSIMYCTHKPCFQCLKRLINAGIKRVLYLHDYADKHQLEFEPQIELVKIDVRNHCLV